MTGQIGTIIVGVILFAFASAILYMIGLKKKMNEDKRLFDMLLNNGAYRVVKYLKTQESITLKGIGYVIKDISAKEFASSKKAVIKDGRAFQDTLLEYMVKEGMKEKLEQFVKNGGTLITTFMSGIVDQS